MSTKLNVVSDRPNQPDPARQQLATDLQNLVAGDVRFSRHDQLLYSTDASLYQVMPIGVVCPKNADDVAKVLAYCGSGQVAVLPRGGGTSLAGQCTAQAVVVDVSPHMRQVLAFDAAAKTITVQPGMTCDEVNRYLAAQKCGLFYAPDPATVAQASIGGCIGNNAAGSRSIVYGRTSENIAALDIVTTNGKRAHLAPGAGRTDPVAMELARAVAALCRKYAPLIRERFPKTIRRNAGYGLDLILKQLDAGVAEEDLDLTGLICGSEGTLAAVTAATLKLHPVCPYKALAVCSYATVEAAMDAVNPILTTKPSAVELLDDVVLGAAMGNNECRHYVELLPKVGGTIPGAVLYVEYQSPTSMAEVDAAIASLETVKGESSVKTYRDTPAMLNAWALRKAGEPLLHGIGGHRKPHTFVEDNAIPVENLPRFVREFKQIVAAHDTTAAYYAHASVGVLHVRPLIDLHDEQDRARMRSIAVAVADLARACGGVMSGEHGDGKVRGPLLERYYGKEIMQAFAETKAIFDPAGVLNPGNIVGAGPVESITDNLRIAGVLHGSPTAALQPLTRDVFAEIDTYYTYDDQEGYRGAVEMCNGAGVCRKTAGGTMCPSFRGTLDERHSTRGRANALRTALSGQIDASGTPNWADPDTIETLDKCLSCKACKSECPSNVDISRLKAEYSAQRYKLTGKTPLKATFFGQVRRSSQLAAIAPGLANFVNKLPPVRAVLNRLLGVSPQRTLPTYSPSLYRWWSQNAAKTNRNAGSGKRVVLYADCFTTYNDSAIGQAAVKVLQACGYKVDIPSVGCCGRAMMSTGLLDAAIQSADGTLSNLTDAIEDDDCVAVVVCEPSCLASIKDDWLQLKLSTPMATRQKLAAKSFLVEDFVDKFWDSHPQKPTFTAPPPEIVLHGHCHQKALWGDETSARLLRRVAGGAGKVQVLPSGCCGMAGSFGYAADKYDLSMKIGELSVFGPVRAADTAATICAPGTSCRHQIHDGTQRHAIHPIELVAGCLKA
jgi:FAD/FMN-containing dehydrogenase/Fe-S oxidoreductase